MDNSHNLAFGVELSRDPNSKNYFELSLFLKFLMLTLCHNIDLTYIGRCKTNLKFISFSFLCLIGFSSIKFYCVETIILDLYCVCFVYF